MLTVATLGAAYSANKGAASMVQALLDDLPGRVGDPPDSGDAAGRVRVVAVSTHPAGDRRAYQRAGLAVAVASQRPLELALLHTPLALLAGLLRAARLPWRWLCRPAALRAYRDADVVADLSGISFVDGRRFPVLVYNALVVLVPLLLGRPVVKCAQALGPFRTAVNRRLARLVLPRLRAVCPRGETTHGHLRELGLTNLVPATDLAFAMRVPDQARDRIRTRLPDSPYLVLAPSQVVDTACRRQGIDSPRVMADFLTAAVADTGRTVVMIAHSAQPDAGVNHMNDLPLCREIYRRLAPDTAGRVVFLDEDLLPTELRAVIAGGELLVTSRFHAMISALAERVPLLVIGWSHKYAEVLEPFGLAEVAMTYAELTTGRAVLDRVRELLPRRAETAAAIGQRLPAAVAAAGASLDALAAAGKERVRDDPGDTAGTGPAVPLPPAT